MGSTVYAEQDYLPMTDCAVGCWWHSSAASLKARLWVREQARGGGGHDRHSGWCISSGLVTMTIPAFLSTGGGNQREGRSGLASAYNADLGQSEQRANSAQIPHSVSVKKPIKQLEKFKLFCSEVTFCFKTSFN